MQLSAKRYLDENLKKRKKKKIVRLTEKAFKMQPLTERNVCF